MTVPRRLRQQTERVEFPIPVATLLTLIDPAEVADGDAWTVVDPGNGTVVLCRDRSTVERFDERGQPQRDPPPRGPPVAGDGLPVPAAEPAEAAPGLVDPRAAAGGR